MILGSLPQALGVCLVLMCSPVMAGERGETSSTSYWYGGSLHPLVITRDGVNYLLIGKQVVEMRASGPTRTYAHADHLGSVRVVTDDQGKTVQSIGYDADYGSTGIEGQTAAATDDSMASFYRFQGQQQETFPLAKLGIANAALAQWLDRIELYHFPWRDYAAGFAAFTGTDPIPTEDSLYAALGANPVNFTDETGGMIRLDEPRYAPAHWQISARLQELLDRLLQDPSANFAFEEVVELNELRLAMVAQRYNRNNPFSPDGILGKRHLETYLGHVEVTEQRRRDARMAFRILRQEQETWLNTYSRPIGRLWEGMNARLGRNMFGEPLDRSEVDEEEKDQDNTMPIENDGAPSQTLDENNDSRMPEPMLDFVSGDALPPSADDEIPMQTTPIPHIQQNEQDDRKQDEHEQEHRQNDRLCCNIL